MTDAPNVELQNQVQLDSLLSGVLISRIASESLAFVHQEGWRTVAPEPDFGKPGRLDPIQGGDGNSFQPGLKPQFQ